jgi:hypothetical protein
VIWLGSTNGQVVTWTDTQIVAAVAATAVTGIVRVQQSGVWSNTKSFTVPGGAVVSLLPNLLNLAVGDSRTLQAVNSAGQTVTGLTWTSSDPSLVSLTSDDPPVLTALATGHITVKAGGASADVTVSAAAPPPGAPIWSNPGNGSGVTSIVPAVPSPTGLADVFAFQNDGTVQAITSDGTTAWAANIGTANTDDGTALADFQGGLVFLKQECGGGYPGCQIIKLDGTTGSPYPAYTCSPSCLNLVVHPDGTIFTIVGLRLVGIDPITGTEKFSVPLTNTGIGIRSPLIVAGDGYAYLAYYTGDNGSPQTVQFKLARMNSQGANDILNIYTRTDPSRDCSDPNSPCSPPVCGPNCIDPNCLTNCLFPYGVSLITNADTGIVLLWNNQDYQSGDQSYHMAVTQGASVSFLEGPAVPGGGTPSPVLQAQDGSFIGVVSTPSGWLTVDFDITGAVHWSIPYVDPKIATEDGGFIDALGNTYDQSGNATGAIQDFAAYSWSGNFYRVGSVEQFSGLWLLQVADSYQTFARGNASRNGAANRPLAKTVQQLISQIALSYVGSHNWLDTPGQNKCNIFVKDVLKQAGLTPPVSPTNPSWKWRAEYLLGLVDTPAYPAQSRDWANAGTNLKCWKPVVDRYQPPALPPDISRPGDVIAEAINYSDAFGHVGIVGGPQQTVSADSASQCVIGQPAGTIDISDYGFRPDNWVDPLSCGRIYGKKKDASVKRFVCQ